MTVSTTQALDHPSRPLGDAQIPSAPAHGVPRAAEGAQLRRPDHDARRGDRPLVRVPQRQDQVALRPAPEARRQADVQERRDRRRAADAADQLAQPDQRAEGFRPHRRRAGRPHQLVRADADDEPVGRPEDRHQARRRHHALLQHDQRRPGVRLRQGRQDRAHDADRPHRGRRRVVDHRGQGPEAHAAAQDHAGAARAEREVDRLFARPPALSDEARRLRSERRAQSAEPRQVRLRAHLMGRGDQARHRRDQAAEARIRSRRHHLLARLASHLGQYRLLPLGAVPLRQCGRHDAHPSQSGLVGRLVLGRGASLGPHAARRPVGDLRHRRGLPAELRHDRVVGGRPGEHVRLLRRAGRHRAPAVAEGSEARHQGRPRRSVLQRDRAVPARQMVRAEADHLGRDGDGDRLRLDQGRPLRQVIRRDPHRRLRQVEGLSRRRRGRHREDAGVAGEGNRRPGEGRARAGARVGQEARLSRARRLGQRPRRRLPQPDRHPVGARDGVPLGDAGPRQARLQHGQPAMGRAARLQFLFPGLRRRRHVGRPRKHVDAGRALPAHAATADHELQQPAHPAHLRAGGDHSTARPRAIRGSASRSSTSSPSSRIRRPAIRRCTCSTSTAARSSRP